MPINAPAVRPAIRELIRLAGGGYNEDLIEGIVENSLKLLTDVENRGDVKVIQAAVREMRYAYRLFAPYAERRKVCIFGSARTKPEWTEYQHAVDFGKRMVEAGFMVITGAGGGIMQAGHEGAGAANSFGCNIRLPWEQNANPVISEDEKLMTFKYFFTRKLTFIRQSDAIALFPGGFGTMDEGYEALTLLQTGKAQMMPIVLIDRPGGTYWKSWDKTVREHLLRNELISPDDLFLYQITDNAEQAVKWITRFYRNYHSMRYVHGKLVIRLKYVPSPSALAALSEDFADIIVSGKVENCETAAEEKEESDAVEHPRIVFDFNRRQYGRLRQLIDVVNSW